ncbi:MAG TPA: SMP-30/gluconolactonase/LRE family protein, partial [Micromonosporaceae bacterium]
EVFTVDARGHADVVARVDSLPLCTAFRPDGRLVIVSSPEGRLLLRDHDGTVAPYVELGHPGWNDIVIDGRGNAYVNGAGYDPATGAFTAGGVTLAAADGTVRAVADDIAFPNGMAVTPDNRTLIVADSHRHCLLAFDIATDGGLSGRRVWADLGDGAPDGICLDADGAVWYADVPHHRCVRVVEGGTVRQTVELDRGGFACVLGGPAGTTLCMVGAQFRSMSEGVVPGSGTVFTIEVKVPGAGWP